jgi:hypothetical protein
MKNFKAACLGLIGILAGSGSALADFEAGHLVVVRVGDGETRYGKGSAAPVFLDEVDPATGAVVRSIPLPTETRRSQRRLTLSMTATSEGQLSTSTDGRYLTLAGYDAPLLMAKVPGSPSDSVPRVVARVDASGRVDTSTFLADGYSKNNVRGVATVDGRRFYLAGAGTGGGSRSVEFAGEGASTLLGQSPDNTRGVAIFEGRLYASVASGEMKGIVAVGKGLPIEGGQTSNLIAPSPIVVEPGHVPASTGEEPEQGQDELIAGLDPKPTGFIFLGGKLYAADLESGLLVYEPDSPGEGGLPRFKLAAKHGPPNLACLAGQLVDGKPVLYGTDGERLLRFTFDGPSVSRQEVARAGPNRAFRGVAFAPTVFDHPLFPLPVVIALGLAGLTVPGAAILALRRKARRRIRFEGTDILIEGGPI